MNYSSAFDIVLTKNRRSWLKKRKAPEAPAPSPELKI
jgi:hypothetical protein